MENKKLDLILKTLKFLMEQQLCNCDETYTCEACLLMFEILEVKELI